MEGSKIRRHVQLRHTFLSVSLLILGVAGVFSSFSFTPKAKVQPAKAQVGANCTTLDVMVVLDRSGSMEQNRTPSGRTRWTVAKLAINRLLDLYDTRNKQPGIDPNKKIRVGLSSFANDGSLDAVMSDQNGYQMMRQKLSLLQSAGETGIGFGIQKAQEEFTAHARTGDVRKVMIVLSDGDENRGSDPIAKAVAAKDSNIEIFSISVDTPGVMPFIASDPGDPPLEHYYHDPDGDDLTSIFEKIAGDACKLPVVIPGPLPKVTLTVDKDAVVGEDDVTVRWTAKDYDFVEVWCNELINDVWRSCQGEWYDMRFNPPDGDRGVKVRLVNETTRFFIQAKNATGYASTFATVITTQAQRLRFCVRHGSDQSPVAGADVAIDSELIRAPQGEPQDHLITGADGCTNPTYIEYGNLEPNASYPSFSSKAGFAPTPLNWTWRPNKLDVIIILGPNADDPRAVIYCVYDDTYINDPDPKVDPNSRKKSLPLFGAHVDLPNELEQGVGDPFQIYSGPDGCTNPYFVNLGYLQNHQGQNIKYHIVTTRKDYDKNEFDWPQPTNIFQLIVVDIYLHKSASHITDVTKSANPDVIKGRADTKISIKFKVDPLPAQSVVIDEKLASNLRFGDTPPVLTMMYTKKDRLGYEITNPITLPAPVVTGNNAFRLTMPSDLAVGLYELSFRAIYSGPFGTNFPIDDTGNVGVGACGGNFSRSHIEYRNREGAQCSAIPAGQIARETGKLVLQDDAWIGDKTTALNSGRFGVGLNSLVLIGGNSSITSPFQIQNYAIPTTGDLEWNKISKEMERRVARSISTNKAKVWEFDCPNGAPVTLNGQLFLDSDKSSPIEAPDKPSPAVWFIRKKGGVNNEGCNIVFTGTYSGTGTLVNNGNVTFTVTGPVNPIDPTKSPKPSFGLVMTSGTFVINGGAQINGMIVYTNTANVYKQ